MPIRVKPPPLPKKIPKPSSSTVKTVGISVAAAGIPALANIFMARSAADVVSNIIENPVALGAVVLVALAVLLR